MAKPTMALFRCLEKGCGHRWRRPATDAPIDCPACPRIVRYFERDEEQAEKLSRRRVMWLNAAQFDVDVDAAEHYDADAFDDAGRLREPWA